VLKDIHLVLIQELLLGPGGYQNVVVRGTMEFEYGTEVYNTIALIF